MPSSVDAREPCLYGEDLAHIHDAGFGDWAHAAANVLLAHAPTGLVVDLGCGSGLLAQQVLRAGRPVLGIDVSPAMLALARKHAPKATLQQGSLLDADIPPCAAVAIVGEGINHCAPDQARRLRKLFQRIHAALQPGGVLLLDAAGPGRANRGTTKTWSEGKDWHVAAEARERGANLTRRIVTFRDVDGRWRRGEETHHLRLLEPKRLKGELEKAGFEVRRLGGYGMLQLPKGHAAFVCRKPSS